MANLRAIDSREVAEMMGKNHRHLIRNIRKYVEHMESGDEPNVGLVDFFYESMYEDTNGQIRPCYLITRKLRR